eukprot:5009150-Amphidinium_carterae.1
MVSSRSCSCQSLPCILMKDTTYLTISGVVTMFVYSLAAGTSAGPGIAMDVGHPLPCRGVEALACRDLKWAPSNIVRGVGGLRNTGSSAIK